MKLYTFAPISAREYPTITLLDNPFIWGGVQFCVNVSEKPYSVDIARALAELNVASTGSFALSPKMMAPNGWTLSSPRFRGCFMPIAEVKSRSSTVISAITVAEPLLKHYFSC